jgi:hypothetical protein
MKRLVFLIFLMSLYLPNFAQNTTIDPDKYINKKTKQIEFSEVVSSAGSKVELFRRCVYWLNDYYKDPTRITQVRDIHTGKIIGRHVIRIYKEKNNTLTNERVAKIYYTFTISFKDGKYKWQIDKLELVSKIPMRLYSWFDINNPDYKPEWEGYLDQLLNFVDQWSGSLKKKMSDTGEKKEKEGKDDW